jgi:hypothetical protein
MKHYRTSGWKIYCGSSSSSIHQIKKRKNEYRK